MIEKLVACRFHDESDSGEKGFTIIEVLVAIAIFAIGMLAIASMQIAATQGTATARSNSELAAFATDQMERLTRLPYNDAELAETGPNVSSHTDSLNDTRFSASWEIADDEIFPNTKTVTLTAVETLRGNNRTLTFQYVIPRR